METPRREIYLGKPYAVSYVSPKATEKEIMEARLQNYIHFPDLDSYVIPRKEPETLLFKLKVYWATMLRVLKTGLKPKD